ncbi:MAG: hypothetical protein M2R45_02575 [Verrucomicrobia subdivision 3 bacterium]|nr:hypothetical protein [Limisphaerales bacterium]MCS1416455.1 hypothetical protein [Limisphaerales bacterium]
MFSGIEAGFLALNPIRIRRLARAKYHAAANLKRHLDDPEPFLWAILIANTAANFSFVAIVFYALERYLSLHPAVYSVVIGFILFAFYTLFDLLPKMLVRRFPNRLTILLTYPFELFFKGIAPFVKLLSKATSNVIKKGKGTPMPHRPFSNREDLRRMLQDTAPNLTSDERDLINRVMDLEDLTIDSVMKPITATLSVPPHKPLKHAVDICRQRSVSNLLVRTRSPESRVTMGTFDLKKLLFTENLNADVPVEHYLTPALYLKTGLALGDALQQMKKSGHRLAIVINQKNMEIGVFTLNDILRNIFKEMKLIAHDGS